VLLLEDDAAFREIVRNCLAENGYTVVAVQTAGEGVREVLASEFTLVLCDFMMPGLPGDMFYRAVERIQPSLCQRFVFMLTHPGDESANEFIRKVDGFVLQKPFPLQHLLDSLALAEVRLTCRSVFDSGPDDPATPSTCTPARGFHAEKTVCLEESLLARILSRTQAKPTPAQGASAPHARNAKSKAAGERRLVLPVAFALLVLLVAALGAWKYVLAERMGVIAAEKSALSEEWQRVSDALDKATPLRPGLNWTLGGPARFAADRARPHWTPALRAIATAAGKEIEILEIHTTSEPDRPDNCTVHVRGTASGADARMVAVRFRQAVEANLKFDAASRPVTARLEHLEDVPGAEPGQELRARFVLVAAFGSIDPAATAHMEAR
jgi:CheY-like chemotaxis protein